jgi:hypothetical protein
MDFKLVFLAMARADVWSQTMDSWPVAVRMHPLRAAQYLSYKWTMISVWHFSALLLTLVCCLPLHAQTVVRLDQTVFELHHTDQGCGVYQPRQTRLTTTTGEPVKVTATYQWSGRCEAGLAAGYGRLDVVTTYGGGSPIRISYKGQRRAGMAIGHTILESKLAPYWSFAYAGRTVGGSLDLMHVSETDIASARVSMPTVATALPKTKTDEGFLYRRSVMSLTQSVTVQSDFCSLQLMSIPYCRSEGEYARMFVVSVMRMPTDLSPAGFSAAYEAREKYVCPNPASIEGCDALFFDKAKAATDEILSFIQATKASVEAEIAGSGARK